MDYLKDQLITYLGNKRSLLPLIKKAYDLACDELDRDSISVLDGFAGSGVVSRFFKSSGANRIIANDFEPYSACISRCFLSNRSQVDMQTLSQIVEEIEAHKLDSSDVGIIESHYAPADDDNIKDGERVFYSNRNARIIDNIRRRIDLYPSEFRDALFGPFLSEASIHTNTSGVFKGFYKDSKTGLGKFGGNKGAALTRILGDVVLQIPVLSNLECEYEVHCKDINVLIDEIDAVDFAYYDPPYNQHPYGSNYHMLNTIYSYVPPTNPSRVAGIPSDWQRSEYNYTKRAHAALQHLIEHTPAKVIAFSYNSEGFVTFDEFVEMCERYGELEVLDQEYNTFRGSKNLSDRNMYVTEYIFMVFK
jgi:adenine-specific DNA-methyltransferase